MSLRSARQACAAFFARKWRCSSNDLKPSHLRVWPSLCSAPNLLGSVLVIEAETRPGCSPLQTKNEAGQVVSQTTAPGLHARAAPGLATLAGVPGTWLQPPACKAVGSCIRHSGMPVCCRRCALGQERECWEEESGVRCRGLWHCQPFPGAAHVHDRAVSAGGSHKLVASATRVTLALPNGV